jgi:hypothetical protein
LLLVRATLAAQLGDEDSARSLLAEAFREMRRGFDAVANYKVAHQRRSL